MSLWSIDCLVCRERQVEEFLDLGTTALANKFLTAEELGRPEPRFPLRVGFCHGCGHVQLGDRVPPAAMFEDYLYMSSASETLKFHFADLAAIVTRRRELAASDLVVDVGCNDASLLKAFSSRGVRTLGVDPAENLAALATGDVERYVGFFGAATAREIADRWGKATVVTCTNTFPHIPALHDFVAGIDHVLTAGGVFVIEAHYLVDILEQLAFDTVYHEHVSYWALGPMARLFESFGMEIVRAERLPIHHGQLRAWVQRRGEGTVDASVAELLAAERERGIDRIETWRTFATATQTLKRDLLRTLRDLRQSGARIAGYGAPAKASTLLEFLEVGPDLIDYIVDRSPLKQGRYTPGSHIPIVGTGRLLEDRPDYVVLLAWNFADEVLAQQAAYRQAGGKFIVPVPAVRIV